VSAPWSETQALITALRELGLRHRQGRDDEGLTVFADFAVRGQYNEAHARRTGERVREFTVGVLYSPRAHEVVAAHRDQVEQRTAELGHPFTVDVITDDSGRLVHVASGTPPEREPAPAGDRDGEAPDREAG